MQMDHVLTLDVVMSGASRSTFGPLTADELVSRAAAPTLDGTICRDLPLLAERHRAAIATGFPRFWRQSGGYRLDRLEPLHPENPAARPELGEFGAGTEGTPLAPLGAV